MSFLELVRRRQSVRQYLPRPVEREKIERCLEAARLAPSASNAQPWHFVVADDPALVRELGKAGYNRFTRSAPAFAAVVCEPGKAVARLGGWLAGQGLPPDRPGHRRRALLPAGRGGGAGHLHAGVVQPAPGRAGCWGAAGPARPDPDRPGLPRRARRSGRKGARPPTGSAATTATEVERGGPPAGPAGGPLSRSGAGRPRSSCSPAETVVFRHRLPGGPDEHLDAPPPELLDERRRDLHPARLALPDDQDLRPPVQRHLAGRPGRVGALPCATRNPATRSGRRSRRSGTPCLPPYTAEVVVVDHRRES